MISAFLVIIAMSGCERPKGDTHRRHDVNFQAFRVCRTLDIPSLLVLPCPETMTHSMRRI
jgi:hypothetical protein